jgi:hypothetical protein
MACILKAGKLSVCLVTMSLVYLCEFSHSMADLNLRLRGYYLYICAMHKSVQSSSDIYYRLVTAISASMMSSQPKRPDLRRNLYILGLPIDLTK